MTPEGVLLALRLLLAFLLYGFLATILWTLWKDAQASRRLAERVPPSQLIVQQESEPSLVYSLLPVNEIGRAADNTLPIVDETVSAYHARVTFRGGQWWLEDLGSRNGTAVNDIPVDQPLVITYGDVISFGRVWCKFESGSPLTSDGGGNSTPAGWT